MKYAIIVNPGQDDEAVLFTFSRLSDAYAKLDRMANDTYRNDYDIVRVRV